MKGGIGRRECLKGLGRNNMVASIIPTPTHRIPSEPHSEAFLGESSTRMGDLLGSPRVAPHLPFFDGISMVYVCICCA